MHRTTSIILALYTAWLFGIFLPGHTRGAVTLEGKTSTGISCCKSVSNQPLPSQPARHDCERCAVCYFWAQSSAPPDVSVDLATVLPLVELRMALDEQVYHADVPSDQGCRDPPALA